MRKIFIIYLCLLLPVIGFSQDRLERIRTELEKIAETRKGLNETVNLSVSDAELQEFIRGIGKAHDLNLSISSDIDATVVNTFKDVKVLDLLVFLCKRYDLTIEFTGDILYVKKYVAPPEPVVVKQAKQIKVSYNGKSDFLSVDLRNDTLYKVAKEITKISSKNIVLSPGLENRVVNAFIQNRPIVETVSKLAYANGLVLEEEGNFLILSLPEKPVAEGGSPVKTKKPGITEGLSIETQGDLLTITATRVPIKDLIQACSDKLFKNYFLFDEPKGTMNLHVEKISYDDFLSYLLNGTEYDYKKDGHVYMIGKRNLEGLRVSKLVQLENRTIESVVKSIPGQLKEGLEVNEFADLNGFVVSGSAVQIHELETFLHQIDVVVPLITIEVIIVDYSKSRSVTTGISAGVGSAPSQGGTLLPGANGTINAATINRLISSFNGFGILNLGGVTKDFYLGIQALEEDGVLKTRSTPQLSTLNGHEADLSIGRTEYYLELQNQVAGINGINPTPLVSQNYKSVNAALKVKVTPFVSSDEQITLEIEVEQSDLTERISDQAPPGKVTRKFNSVIRVKNGEMVLLGGLEDKSINQSGSGLPFLARVPVIKWLFGKRTRSKSKSKLNVFIRPHVQY